MMMSTDISTASTSYDIVIVGGGMVGVSLALLLEDQYDWKILLIEAQTTSRSADATYSPSFDARSTALSWSTRRIYQSIGLWSELEPFVSTIDQIHVSDRGHIGLTRIDAQAADVEALGYVIENQRLGAALLNRLNSSRVEFRSATRIEAVKPIISAMQLTLDNSDSIQAKLLVIADGAGSSTADMLGIISHAKSYQQSGIIANISLGQPHQGVAYERFTDQGPLALLPLSHFQGRPRSALVWTLPEDQAESLMQADDQVFLTALQERFGYRLGTFAAVGERLSYPLALTTASEQVRSNLVVMGNAAHSLHPVAGQGFNLSLRDAASLANTLGDAPQAIGELKTLQDYQRNQATDQRNTLLFTDSLPNVFGISSALVAMGRNTGLVAMDLVAPLREQFARFGTGMTTAGVRNG